MIEKEKLIEALRKEKVRLPEVNAFGEENDFIGYEKTIKYLETGEYSEEDADRHSLLYEAIHNIEELFDTYL